MAAGRFLDGFKRMFIPKFSKKLIGQDHLGNKYYEVLKPGHQWRKKQRYFEAPGVDPTSYIVVDKAKVPPAWNAWLRFRRDDPPTVEEVQESEDYFVNQQNLAAEKKMNKQDESKQEKNKYDGGGKS